MACLLTCVASLAGAADLSGKWIAITQSSPLQTIEGDALPLTEAGRQQQQVFINAKRSGASGVDPIERCIPAGVPRIYALGQPFIIAQRPYLVLMMFQVQRTVRQIYLQREAYPEELGPSYMGNSLATWDGSTLIVTTRDFKAPGFLDSFGAPFSTRLQVEERLTRVNNRLEDTLTINDPEYYTKPWRTKLVFKPLAGTELEEDVCADRQLLKLKS